MVGNQFNSAQTDSKLVSQELAVVKQSLKELQDQNKLLHHHKWVLAQEKAQFEGQLKQMQKMIMA